MERCRYHSRRRREAHERMTLEFARNRIAELEEENETADKLIEERNRVLDALPCGSHGRCVPHALAEIGRLQSEIAKLREERDRLLAVHEGCGPLACSVCGRPEDRHYGSIETCPRVLSGGECWEPRDHHAFISNAAAKMEKQEKALVIRENGCNTGGCHE